MTLSIVAPFPINIFILSGQAVKALLFNQGERKAYLILLYVLHINQYFTSILSLELKFIFFPIISCSFLIFVVCSSFCGFHTFSFFHILCDTDYAIPLCRPRMKFWIMTNLLIVMKILDFILTFRKG